MSVVQSFTFRCALRENLRKIIEEQHDNRHEAEHHQRQLIVQKQHRNQNTDDHEEVLQKIDQKVGEHQRNRVRIVCRSRDKLSDRNLI